MADGVRHIALIRHVKSNWSQGGDDFDRPISQRGVASAARLKPWLAAHGPAFDLVLCSPARRTMETMMGLGLGAVHQAVPDLYLADKATIFSVLNRAPMGQNIALIAHNPGIGHAAAALVAQAPDHPRFADYPTGATLIAACPAEGAITPGQAALVGFVVPGDLSRD